MRWLGKGACDNSRLAHSAIKSHGFYTYTRLTGLGLNEVLRSSLFTGDV